MAGEADSVSSLSASACHIGGPNSVNPGQILLVYGILFSSRVKIFPTVLSLEREFGTREHTDSDKSEISAKPTFYNPPTVVSL